MPQPARRSLAAMVILLILAPFVLAPAAWGYESKAPMVAFHNDNASYSLSSVGAVIPLTIVDVELTLQTSDIVTEINSAIVWDSTQLTLQSMEIGSALQGVGGTFLPGAIDLGATSFTWSLGDPGATIDPALPVVVFHFLVECFGYASAAPVSFKNGALEIDSDNFYVSGGTTWTPNKNPGSVTTQLNLVSFQTSSQSALPGQSVQVPVRFYSSIPGTPTVVDLDYDPALLQFESAALDSVFTAGTLSVDTSTSGVVHLEFIGTNLLAEPLVVDVASVTFTTSLYADGYTTAIDYGPATISTNVCNESPTSITNGGAVTVPQHTASLTLANATPYTTSTYYDVPVVLDSTFPIDDYQFQVLTAPYLEFLGVEMVGGFPLPMDSGINPVVLDGVETANVHLFETADLPASGFKLRFRAPTPAPAAGTTYDIKFVNPGASFVEYVVSIAPPVSSLLTPPNLILQDGTITVRRPPIQPSCPTLYVWSGGTFARENTILAACAAADQPPMQDDITDYYHITQPVQTDGGVARFAIREDDLAVSHFREMALIAVDHAKDTQIQVTEDGSILQLSSSYQLRWAVDDQGNDITDLVQSLDRVSYSKHSDGWIEVGFGRSSRLGEISSLAAIAPSPPKENLFKTGGSGAGSLEVSVRLADGSWIETGTSHPRYSPNPEAVVVDVQNLDLDDELVLRYQWTGFYGVDIVELRNVLPLEREPVRLSPVTFEHSVAGSVLGRGNNSLDGVVLSRGEQIDLSFDLGSLGAADDGMVRDYVFVSTGRYAAGEEDQPQNPATTFFLSAARPNPFNPSTTISFSLPETTPATLTIFDLRGARVRTLIDAELSAGNRSVVWDGRSDDGAAVASGTYFYKLRTPTMEQTRKMTLLK